MKPMVKKASLAVAIAIAAQLFLGTAWAAPPANVVGTWTVLVNQTLETLVITNQGNPGTHKLIIGTIGIAPIQGWYNPNSGRIHFVHKNLSTGATVRVFTGNLSSVVPNVPNRMAGTFTVINVAFGPFGEFNFAETK